jgi:hypothetical protein
MVEELHQACLPFDAASVSILGRFLRSTAGAATPAEPVGVASGRLLPVSGDCAAVGVASVGAVGHIVGGGAAAGMLWCDPSPGTAGFAGGGGAFVGPTPRGLLAGVVVPIAVGGAC